MNALIRNPLMLMTTVILLGQLIGRLEFKHIKLGSSATLFVSLGLSYLMNKYLGIATNVPGHIFTLSLIGFISTVGLMASSNIRSVLKQYGVRFVVLGFVITATGAAMTKFFMGALSGHSVSVIGTFVGALTSSPGLATALELAKSASVDRSALIGLGYSIAYLPGVLAVIFFPQIVGRRVNLATRAVKADAETVVSAPKFSIVEYALVVFVGMILGSLKVQLSPTMTFSLGMTGGVLLSALALGNSKFISSMRFVFDPRQLGVIRDLSLNMFLAIVGLDYGYEAVLAIQQSGLALLGVGIATALSSVIVGYLVGRYLLKIDLYYLVGGVCGGMTSTPGLAAAIDTFNSDEVVSGYGATYPFALLFMIILTNLLFMG